MVAFFDVSVLLDEDVKGPFGISAEAAPSRVLVKVRARSTRAVAGNSAQRPPSLQSAL